MLSVDRQYEARYRALVRRGWLRRLLVVIAAGALLAAAVALSPRTAPAQEVGTGWCCGISDCGVLDKDAVRAGPRGYMIDGYVSYFLSINHSAGGRAILGPFDHSEHVGPEVVPYSETRPSPDGLYWRCKYPDGARRCLFAPRPAS